MLSWLAVTDNKHEAICYDTESVCLLFKLPVVTTFISTLCKIMIKMHI